MTSWQGRLYIFIVCSFASAPASVGAIKVSAARPREQAFMVQYSDESITKVEPSGLMYTVLREGTGGTPGPSTKCKCHYEGRTALNYPDGKTFDSSIARGVPSVFAPNQVIPCWSEAMQTMKVGGKRELVCPPELAYKGRAMGDRIPAWSVLVFSLEIVACDGVEGPAPSRLSYTALLAATGPWPQFMLGMLVVVLAAFNALKLPIVAARAVRSGECVVSGSGRPRTVAPPLPPIFLRPGFVPYAATSAPWHIGDACVAIALEFGFVCVLFGVASVARSALWLAALALVHTVLAIASGLSSAKRTVSLGGAAVALVGLAGNCVLHSALVLHVTIVIFNVQPARDATVAFASLCARASAVDKALPAILAASEMDGDEDES
jgi:FKBP-type peptidyl-prolyl cis-trans isomerase